MNSSLQVFLMRLAGTVCLTLAPVVLTVFMSVPYTLEGHPGEPRLAQASATSHMT